MKHNTEMIYVNLLVCFAFVVVKYVRLLPWQKSNEDADKIQYYPQVPVLGTLKVAEYSLNGQHLRVIISEFPVSLVTQRNATGHVIFVDGVQSHMMAALSRMFNFSYSYLPIIVLQFDDSPNAKGASHYLLKNEADFCLSTFIGTPSRFQKVDFPASWFYGPFGTLVPYPRQRMDMFASFKPLSYQVWILVGTAAFFTIFYLRLMQKLLGRNWAFVEDKTINKRSRENVVLYVMGNLLSQGQHFLCKRMVVRLAAGAWCCGCFFLVQIYCSTLTSHLTSPNQNPIVNSFFEIAGKPGVSLSVDRASGLNNLLQNAQSTHAKKFIDTLTKDNRYITCNVTADCLKYVKKGNVAFAAPYNVLKIIVADDIKNSDTCNFTMTKEMFWNTYVFTALRKNSPYTNNMSIGILRLIETGFISKWEKWYVPSPSKCLEINKKDRKPRLSLNHLSSAFVILITGYILTIVVFFFEKLC